MPKTARVQAKKAVATENPEQTISEVVNLIKLMGETGLAELRMESPGLKVSLKKESTPSFVGFQTPSTLAMPSMVVPQATASASTKTTPTEPAKTAPKIDENAKYHQVCSPMAGTFYRQPSPNSPPYVKEGDQVKNGQPLCIIEAMKLMNEIKSEVTGKIIKIVAENAKPVDKGSILFLVDKNS
ncbi:MAG TPA: acetyl-CoA carboxylase biotin carboxyl carrier protein [Candidatus Ozemobacteraceae bacterium]|nr:acetyl-CoA carboxylase biotin carboxyl carrier protein [Candidatus Ozemobacteraceae bacterium]